MMKKMLSALLLLLSVVLVTSCGSGSASTGSDEQTGDASRPGGTDAEFLHVGSAQIAMPGEGVSDGANFACIRMDFPAEVDIDAGNFTLAPEIAFEPRVIKEYGDTVIYCRVTGAEEADIVLYEFDAEELKAGKFDYASVSEDMTVEFKASCSFTVPLDVFKSQKGTVQIGIKETPSLGDYGYVILDFDKKDGKICFTQKSYD